MRRPGLVLFSAINTIWISRRFQAVGTMTLFVLGPLLALATFVLIGGPFSVGAENALLRFVLLFDLVYVLVVAALVINRIFRIIVARRAKSAGSRLHLRLAGVFSVVALTPTILVAIFAMLTINMGLEALILLKLIGLSRGQSGPDRIAHSLRKPRLKPHVNGQHGKDRN